MNRSQLIPSVAALCIGIVVGSVLRSASEPDLKVVRVEEEEVGPTKAVSGGEGQREELWRAQVLELRARLVEESEESEKKLALLHKALETAKQMLSKRRRDAVRGSGKKTVKQVVAEDPEFYADKVDDERRFVPYMPNRPYRAYRPFKVYEVNQNSWGPGTKKDCKNYPSASECRGTFSACKRDTDVAECGATDLYCRKFPSSPYCMGTEVYCNKNPKVRLCQGTLSWCRGRPNTPMCRGTKVACEKNHQGPSCLGTKAYCLLVDSPICPESLN